jgi:hypothetical protein
MTDEVARTLQAKYPFASYDGYGKCTKAGYVVTEGSEGRARVTHQIPDPDLFDVDRPSDDSLAAERHRMVDEYADVLTAAGWIVEKRGPRSRKPYLLVTRTTA